VITTTAAATGGFVSESVSYLDVGLKLEVEPQIFLEDEVGIKVGLEVSNIVKEIRQAGSNTLAYQIGTRNAATALRLRDGETQVLAGLISNEDRQSAVRVPGLGELPMIGRLFSSTTDNRVKTELVLLITPRQLRQIARPDAGSVEFAAGTESSSGTATRPSIVAPFVPQGQPAQPGQVEGAPPPGDEPLRVPAPIAPPSGSTQVPFGGLKPTPQ